jgi:hypothetical protein
VSVDNIYTGVGYEPTFETPSDKDFMAAHIESLESRVRELEDELETNIGWNKSLLENLQDRTVERDRLKESVNQQKQIVIDLLDDNKRLIDEKMELRARHAALYESASKFRQAFVIAVGDKSPFAKVALDGIDKELQFYKLKDALAEVK